VVKNLHLFANYEVSQVRIRLFGGAGVYLKPHRGRIGWQKSMNESVSYNASFVGCEEGLTTLPGRKALDVVG
jgi:hypothetical protein